MRRMLIMTSMILSALTFVACAEETVVPVPTPTPSPTSLTAPTPQPTPSPAPITSGHVTADIDGDTLPDIVYFSSKWNEEYNDYLGNLYIALELGNGETVEVMPPYEGNFYADYSNSLFLEDLTGDGIADIIASPEVYGSNYGAEKVYVYTMVNGELELLPADIVMHENPVTTAWGYTPNMNYRDASSTIGGFPEQHNGETLLVLKEYMHDESKNMAWNIYAKWNGSTWDIVDVKMNYAWIDEFSEVTKDLAVGESCEYGYMNSIGDLNYDGMNDDVWRTFTKQEDGTFIVEVSIRCRDKVFKTTLENPVEHVMNSNVQVIELENLGKTVILLFHVVAESEIYGGDFDIIYLEDGEIKHHPKTYYLGEHRAQDRTAEYLKILNVSPIFLTANIISYATGDPGLTLVRYDPVSMTTEDINIEVTDKGLGVLWVMEE